MPDIEKIERMDSLIKEIAKIVSARITHNELHDFYSDERMMRTESIPSSSSFSAKVEAGEDDLEGIVSVGIAEAADNWELMERYGTTPEAIGESIIDFYTDACDMRMYMKELEKKRKTLNFFSVSIDFFRAVFTNGYTSVFKHINDLEDNRKKLEKQSKKKADMLGIRKEHGIVDDMREYVLAGRRYIRLNPGITGYTIISENNYVSRREAVTRPASGDRDVIGVSSSGGGTLYTKPVIDVKIPFSQLTECADDKIKKFYNENLSQCILYNLSEDYTYMMGFDDLLWQVRIAKLPSLRTWTTNLGMGDVTYHDSSYKGEGALQARREEIVEEGKEYEGGFSLAFVFAGRKQK